MTVVRFEAGEGVGVEGSVRDVGGLTREQQTVVEQVLTGFGIPVARISAAIPAINGQAAVQVESDEFLPPGELCARLVISKTTLWRYDVPFHWVAGRKRYRLGEVVRFFESHPAKAARAVKAKGNPTKETATQPVNATAGGDHEHLA